MKSNHITDILDSADLNNLSQSDSAQIQSHTADCGNCRRAYQAARVSSVLLRAHAAETFEPSPFFQTKVMAALREMQAANPVASFWRWWQASSLVVAAMLIAVVGLVVLTLFAPNTLNESQERATAWDDYSTETVILNQEKSSRELTTTQALQIIYDR